MAPPTTITVFDNVYGDSGAPLVGTTVTCVLDSTVETFASGLIAASTQSTVTDGNGRFAFTLIPNDLLTPLNSTYTIQIPSIGRTYQIAPQSGNGNSQQSTAANVIVNTPAVLALQPTLSGTYTGAADFAIRSLTALPGAPYAAVLPGNSGVATPAGVITGNHNSWQWGSGVYSVLAAGAKGDGTTNDDAAFTLAAQAAAAWVASAATVGNRATILVPQASEAYLLGGTGSGNGPFTAINMSGITIRGDNSRVRLSTARQLNAAYCFRFDHGTSSAPDGDVWIDGIFFDGNERNATYGTPIYATENSAPTASPVHVAIYAIWLNRIRITNCNFYDFAREAIWMPYGVALGFEQFSRMDVDIDNCLFYLTAKAITIETARRVKIDITVDTPLCSDTTYLDRIVTLNLDSIAECTIDGRFHGGGRSGNLAVASGNSAGTTSVTCFPIGTDLPSGTIVWDSGMTLWLGYGQTNVQKVTLTSAVHAGDTTVNLSSFTPTINFPIGAALTGNGGRYSASYECISQGGTVALGNLIVRGSYRGWYANDTVSGNIINVGNDTPATLGQQGATTLSVNTGTSPITAITVNALPTAIKNRQQLILVSGSTQQTIAVNNVGGYASGSTAITVTSFTPSINFPSGTYVLWGSSGEITVDNVSIDDSTAWFGIKARGHVTTSNPRIARVGGVGYYDAGSYNKLEGGSIRACNTQKFAAPKRCGILLGNASPDAVDNPSVVGTRVVDDGVQQNMYAIGTGLGSVTNAHIDGCDFSGCAGVDGNNFNANVCKQTGAEVRNNKGWNPVGAVTTPGFPATTVGQANTTGMDVKAIIVNGANTMTYTLTATAGGLGTVTSRTIPANAYVEVLIPAQQTFTPTYGGGAPVWTWYGL